MVVLSAVGLVTGGTTLTEGRLVVVRFLRQVGDIAVAAQADLDRVRFGKPRLPAGVGAVAISAVARRPRMLHFGSVDQLGFVVVASHAQCLGIGLCQHHFSILGRRVADFALLVGEGRMGKLCHQLGSGGLVGIVTAHAIGRFERLVLVRFLQISALDVMAIHTKRRGRLGEMKVELDLADLARLMRDVAGVAAHVEGRVPAAFLGNVYAGLVTAQAEVLFLVPRGGLQQLILVVRGVRSVTLYAVAHGWGMNFTFYVGGILVRVAGQTESTGSRRDQLYTRDIFIDSNLVATGAAHGNRGMDRLAL